MLQISTNTQNLLQRDKCVNFRQENELVQQIKKTKYAFYSLLINQNQDEHLTWFTTSKIFAIFLLKEMFKYQ